MVQTPTPVGENDPDEVVLMRILVGLDQTGPLGLKDMMSRLKLYDNKASKKVLKMAKKDGSIKEDSNNETFEVTEFGKQVAEELLDVHQRRKRHPE